jgi:hypothetical protein
MPFEPSGKRTFILSAGEHNIELAMGKNGNAQVQANTYNRLALGLVDGHCKSKVDRKLTAGKRDMEVLIGRLDIHSGNKNKFSSMFTTQDAALQHMPLYIHQDHACAIAETLIGIKVT